MSSLQNQLLDFNHHDCLVFNGNTLVPQASIHAEQQSVETVAQLINLQTAKQIRMEFRSLLHSKARVYTNRGKIIGGQFHIQMENAVMFLEHWLLFFPVVAEPRYERNVSRFCFVAFQFHRWAKKQRNQWANASDVRQQCGLANRQISGRQIART